MTAPKPMTEWQAQTLPVVLTLSFRRNVAPGPDGCWLWIKSCNRDGYGWASFQNHTHEAHRLAYTLVCGPVPEGLVLDHTCHNADTSCAGGRTCIHRRCVNPAHLEPVTPLENLLRSPLTPAGRVECLLGHGPLSSFHNQRRCLVCYEAKRTTDNAAQRRKRRTGKARIRVYP